jgi:hypothetical protein
MPWLAWSNPPIYASHIAGMIGVSHNTQLLLVEMGSHKHFVFWTILASFSFKGESDLADVDESTH